MIKKIGLGTVQFGMSYGISNTSGKTQVEEVRKILRTAKNFGIKLLDSASGYGNAEEVLGENDLDSFDLVSKYLPPTPEANLFDQLHRSLENFQKSSIYAYLAHRPVNLLENPQQWEELLSFRELGKVKKIGFSLNDPGELDALLKAEMFPDLVQVPFNYFDRRFESHLKELKENTVEIHTRSTFLQGLFFMQPESLDDYFDEVRWEIKNVQSLQGSLAGSLLNFVLEKPFVDKLIMGVENCSQLEYNLENLKNAVPLPELQKKISDKILKPAQWPKL